MSAIRFDGGSHWYAASGKPCHDADLRDARKEKLFPSVTTIDKDSFKNDFLDIWKTNQLLIAASENHRQPHESATQYGQRIYDISMEKSRTAIEFGKEIHDAVEVYPQLPMNSLLMPWFNEFGKWWEASGLDHVASEITLIDKELGIAGRTDKIARRKSNGKRVVLDWKTQDVKVNDKGKKKPAFYDSWGRQLAFYGGVDSKDAGLWPELPECCSLIIDSNPDGKVYEKWWTPEEIKAAYIEFLAGAWLWFNKRGYWPVGEWKVSFDRPMPA